MHLASQRDKVIIPTNKDCTLGADLDAGIALPAGIRLLVVGFHGLNVENHQVVGADVHARGFVAALATITFCRIYVTWH